MWKLIRENQPFFVPYACLLVILGTVQLVYDRTTLFLFVNAHHTRESDFFFRHLTNVGDGLFYVAVALGLLFVQYRYALAAVLCFVLTGLAAQLLKRFVFTEALRPSRFYENSDVTWRAVEGVQLYGNNSFPSGHATTAFSLFCLLALVTKPKRWGYAFVILAFWTSYSRVYLAQHFVGDVYFGSLLGILLTLLTASALLRYFETKPRPWHDQRLGRKRRQPAVGNDPEKAAGNQP